MERVKADEAPLWDAILTDPLAKRFLEDPMVAVKEVMEITRDYAKGFVQAS